jgi:hypothetical protein
VCEGERGSGLGLTKRANWAHARIRPNGQDLWWFQAKGGRLLFDAHSVSYWSTCLRIMGSTHIWSLDSLDSFMKFFSLVLVLLLDKCVSRVRRPRRRFFSDEGS